MIGFGTRMCLRRLRHGIVRSGGTLNRRESATNAASIYVESIMASTQLHPHVLPSVTMTVTLLAN